MLARLAPLGLGRGRLAVPGLQGLVGVTHHPVRVLADGTRVYSNGTKRTPVPDHLRKYKKRKPDDPRAVLWQGNWLFPLVLIGDDSRVMPTTRPDTDAYDHMSKPRKCKCDVCKRPEAKRWKNQWRRERRRDADHMKSPGDPE